MRIIIDELDFYVIVAAMPTLAWVTDPGLQQMTDERFLYSGF
jgi:hypothetical protein